MSSSKSGYALWLAALIGYSIKISQPRSHQAASDKLVDTCEDEKKQRMYEWLRSEQDLANDRIANYPEADQKIIAAMATVIAAVIGISVAKVANVPEDAIPYVLFTASFLMSLAVNQSSLYSSLTLIYIERKLKLAKEMGKFLDCDPDFAHCRKNLYNFSSMWSYKYSVLPYFLFKIVVGPALCIAGLLHEKANYNLSNFKLAFWTSFIFSILSATVVISHVIAGIIFDRKFNYKNLEIQDRAEGRNK